MYRGSPKLPGETDAQQANRWYVERKEYEFADLKKKRAGLTAHSNIVDPVASDGPVSIIDIFDKAQPLVGSDPKAVRGTVGASSAVRDDAYASLTNTVTAEIQKYARRPSL